MKIFLFLVIAAIMNGGRTIENNFESGPLEEHPIQIRFNLVQ